MRVTQGIMYNSFVSNMNRTLGDYMESNIQSSSQKRVNRPSDDPVAAGRIMSSRATLNKMETWKENIDTAYGWLSLADQVLGSSDGSVQNILSRIKVLAEEGASGEKSADNRLQISYEIRQHFEQLINIANTEFQGSHIFAGHKTDQPAYVEGMAVTCLEGGGGSVAGANFNVIGGKLPRTMVIQVTDVVDDPTDPNYNTFAGATFRYSVDGGANWESGITANNGTLTMGGVTLAIDDPTRTVSVVDTGLDHSNNNGTWLYVRPTAIYQGDDHDNLASQNYWPDGATKFVNLEASGNFSRDVAVRLDKDESGKLYYSYSTDDGANWTQTTAPSGSTTLAVPGGYLTLDQTPVMPQDEGSQFIIHPHRADVEFQIADNSTITVNTVGKEIFGGLYDDPTSDPNYPTAVEFSNGGNLFEVVGRLIAAAETNSQQGMQQALEELNNVMDVVLTKTAEIGGRENRLTATAGLHLVRQYSEEDTLSRMEDADVTELMTRLAQQQVAYQSVLKSSSMIMQMSLVNFL
ncbi:flagellar hook-associated protein FlgL [Desulfovibrio sp. OttesenSCG-928-G11]|nr:flagellar hook-associated protein FlgL [Desulfovibrio sp. OttesenSCG-928-G11]